MAPWRLLACGVALLTGCAALAPAPETPSLRPPRAEISRFQLEGRVAVRNGEQSFSAHVDWEHDPGPADRMRISTPLGQGLAELVSDRDGARLETADRQSFDAPDLDSLSEHAFGARLPLSRLPRWVVGKVAGASPDLLLDALGRPLAFSEDGWRVAYPAYEDGSAAALPSLIHLRRDGLEVRLKVDRWTIEP
jgi:outer membrane lipoprotein LolB